MMRNLINPGDFTAQHEDVVSEISRLREIINTRSSIASSAFESLRSESDHLLEQLNADTLQLLQPLLSIHETIENQFVSVLSVQQKMLETCSKQQELLSQILKAYQETYSMLELCAVFRDYAAYLRDVVCLVIEEKLGPNGMEKLGWDSVAWHRVCLKRRDDVARARPKDERIVDKAVKETLEQLNITFKEFEVVQKFRKDAAGLFHQKNYDLATAINKMEITNFPDTIKHVKPALKKSLEALSNCPTELAEVIRRNEEYTEL